MCRSISCNRRALVSNRQKASVMQLQCNVVMGIHSLNWASMLREFAEATGDEKMRQRAIQTANYITYYLQPDNRIVVGFQYHQWWYSCLTGVVLCLLDFVDEAGGKK